MEEITFKIDIPSESKEEFKRALAKVVKQFVENMKVSLVNEISEISEGDSREVKDSLVQEVIKSCEETSKRIKSGEIKPMTLDDFNKWCE